MVMVTGHQDYMIWHLWNFSFVLRECQMYKNTPHAILELNDEINDVVVEIKPHLCSTGIVILTNWWTSVGLQEEPICQIQFFVHKCQSWYFNNQVVFKSKQITCFLEDLKNLYIHPSSVAFTVSWSFNFIRWDKFIFILTQDRFKLLLNSKYVNQRKCRTKCLQTSPLHKEWLHKDNFLIQEIDFVWK